MSQNNLADRGKASKDAWFGCCFPVRASQRLWLVAVLALLVAPLAFGVQRWERWYGGTVTDDYIRDILQTGDGGYIFGGVTSATHGQWLVKLDSFGDTLWTRKCTPDSGNVAGILALTRTRDGGYAMTGGSGTSLFIMKTDSLGDSLWLHLLQEPHGAGYDIEQMNDGGFVIVGLAWVSSQPEHAYIVRTDSLGDTLWTKTYGSQGSDYACAVKATRDKGVVFAGIWGGSYYEQGWLVHLDSLGNIAWSKTFLGPSNVDFASLCLTPDGGIAAAGGNQAGQGYCYLVRADSLGDTLWTRTLQSPLGCRSTSVSTTRDGGFILGGIAVSQHGLSAHLVKTDSNGNEQWSQDYDGYPYCYAAQQTSDLGCVLAGYCSDSAGSDEGFVIKTDKYGSAAVAESREYRRPEELVPLIRVPGLVAGQLTCQYFLPTAGRARIELFDALGRRLSRVDMGYRSGGWHDLQVPVAPPAGARFLRVNVHGQSATVKFIVP